MPEMHRRTTEDKGAPAEPTAVGPTDAEADGLH